MLSTRPHVVLVDANVLYSRTLRDWLALIYLEDDSLFRIRWTTDIMAEVIYHLRRQHPDWCGDKIEAARRHIEETFADGRVTSYQIDDTFLGRDPNDAHVHAAAIGCGADLLLTGNAADFLPTHLDPDALAYEVWHPDDFFLLVDDAAPQVVRAVTERQLSYWLEIRGEADLPRQLRRAGVPAFGDRVRCHVHVLRR